MKPAIFRDCLFIQELDMGTTRRDALRFGLATGAALTWAPRVWAADLPVITLPVITRAIPSTGEKLPVVGLGTDQATRAGEASFNRSLAHLKTAQVDLLQVHNLEGVEALLPVMQRWKKEGKIRYIGITTSRVGQHSHMVEYMRQYPLDFVQVDYSLANRDAAANVLPLALEKRVAVLANVPFGYGSVLRQAQSRQLPDWAADIDVTSWSQFLLKYVIAHPAVTCVIPGSTQVEHLEQNQLAGRGRLPDEALRKKMEAVWDAG
jgi:aryl-alcohol dehydrogenase-like predicted oxidoreductase